MSLLPAAIQAAPVPAIRVDQIGYLTNETKLAMVVSATATGAFDVRRVSDNVSVLNGTLSAATADTASGDSVRTADFSSVTTAGNYYLDVAGVGTSYDFQIGPNVFGGTYLMALRAFYSQRCGTAVNMGTIGGVTYSHAICHASGAATDLPSTYHSSSGLTGTKNTPKGWHDAGDYGKYIVNSGISTGELLWTYESYSAQIGNLNLNIPESGNATPDILDEARWNLEWMLTLQDADGGVWHKNTSLGFGAGFPLPENDAAGIRYIIGTGPGAGAAPYKTSCSSADFAAVMAIAARVYQPFDATFANTCRTAAQNAWTWVSANPTVYYTQPTGVSTGGYGDNNSTDERLWAAAELFRTTGTATYSTYVVNNAGASPLFSATAVQGWAGVKNLALWTYWAAAGADATLRNRIQTDTLSAATSIANRTNGATNGYRVSLTGYNWGSNGDAANYGIYLLMANRMSANASYVTAALNNLHYLLGRNTHSYSFVTHVGDRPYLHPHHRPSGSPQYTATPPWPGLLSGGPNSSSNDGSGLDALPANPPAKRWVDQTASYASNEIAINWQAPLVYLLASTINGAIATPTLTPGAGTPTPTPTFTATSTRTSTATPTRTATSTATNSSTLTRTSTSTATVPVNTATSTPTASRTATPSSTNTSTSTATRTSSSTSTSTATIPANTATSTSTVSRTATPSSTSTSTPTATRTSSSTPTSTNTATSTSTASRTATPSSTSTPLANTATPTNTVTRTATPSSTNTLMPTGTATSTATRTATSSSTSTASPSSTSTSTTSRTLTASPTSTNTGAPTATQTSTFTTTDTPIPTLTSTATVSRTATPSATSTASSTLTSTPSSTMSPTSTPSMTFTASLTMTRTATASSTLTLSPTQTVSPTATDTGAPTATSSPSRTATPSATMTNTLPPTPTSTPTPTASSTPTSTLTASRTATPSPTNSPTSTQSPSPTFTTTAVATSTPTSSSTSTATGVPTATSSASRTATPSATHSLTPTPSPSATRTLTPTSTQTLTVTLSPTAPSTGTATSTQTPPPVPGATPVIIPNPIVGPTAQILPQAYLGTSDVKVQVYTSAFKLILTKTFPSVPSGFAVTLDLVDEWGEPLASGLFYVAVTVQGNRAVAKLVLAP